MAFIMDARPLYAPWRMQYIRSLEKHEDSKCFLCEASRDELSSQQQRERLVLWTTPLSVVVINRFPYTNGHLLISPKAHKAELDELTDEELLDMQRQTRAGIALLRRAVSAQGFNIGINLGRCAGAGLPGHLHQHLVPRWRGDTNFISVVGEVRVIPEAMMQLYDELRRLCRDMNLE
jgi:ATP adenylyltransferase